MANLETQDAKRTMVAHGDCVRWPRYLCKPTINEDLELTIRFLGNISMLIFAAPLGFMII